MDNLYILVIDAGGTKTRWTLIDKSINEAIDSSVSVGINATTTPVGSIEGTFAQKSSLIKKSRHIFYYGAGCSTPEACGVIEDLLRKFADANVYIEVSSDILGATRALLNNEKGIAAILGTGSNTCLYDGTNILKNVPPMGYILGDEGSGSALGKRFLADIYRGILPDILRLEFESSFQLSYTDVLRLTYKNPDNVRFLSSLAPFITSKLNVTEVRLMVEDVISQFFKRNIDLYEEAHSLPIAFTGSLALALSDIIHDYGDRNDYNISTIVAEPSPLLVKYYCNVKL